MHILAVEEWPTLLAGGQERSLFEVISGLRSQGVDVTLAYKQEGDLVARYNSQGVHTFRIAARMPILKSWRSPVHLARFAQSVWRILAEHRRARIPWTLIYVNQYADVTLAILSGALLRIPAVCHLRLAAPPHLSRQFRWGLERCKLLVCNSQFTANTYIGAGISKEKIQVVHNAIDTEAFHPVADDRAGELAKRNQRQVLYVGRLSPEKGLEVLIDAVADARSRDGRISLLIVGNLRGSGATAEYYASLRARADERLGSAVEFKDATDDPARFYRDADLTVLPSVWDEPFGRVLIESMACGVPCLAGRGGGVPEILTGELAMLLFKKADVRDLAVRIEGYIDWRLLNPGLSQLCRRAVLTKFSSVTMNQRLLELLYEAERRS